MITRQFHTHRAFVQVDLASVEPGQAIVATRRGKPVANVTPAMARTQDPVGSIRHGPAPRNLEMPSHVFKKPTQLPIG